MWLRSARSLRLARRIAACLGAAAFLGFATGCFVFDELDKGSAELDRASSKKPPEPATAAPGAAKPAAQPNATAQWWTKARSIGGETADASIVGCRIGGRTEYMRDVDCQARGGKILDR
jgi:hypothetical protein